MPATATVKADATISANAIIIAARKCWGIPNVEGVEVRNLVRKGVVLPRFAGRPSDGGNWTHDYTKAEAVKVVRAFAAIRGRRSGNVDSYTRSLLKALGLPVGPVKAAKAANGTTGTAKAARPVNRALGQRAVRVKPAEVAPEAAPEA